MQRNTEIERQSALNRRKDLTLVDKNLYQSPKKFGLLEVGRATLQAHRTEPIVSPILGPAFLSSLGHLHEFGDQISNPMIDSHTPTNESEQGGPSYDSFIPVPEVTKKQPGLTRRRFILGLSGLALLGLGAVAVSKIPGGIAEVRASSGSTGESDLDFALGARAKFDSLVDEAERSGNWKSLEKKREAQVRGEIGLLNSWTSDALSETAFLENILKGRPGIPMDTKVSFSVEFTMMVGDKTFHSIKFDVKDTRLTDLGEALKQNFATGKLKTLQIALDLASERPGLVQFSSNTKSSYNFDSASSGPRIYAEDYLRVHGNTTSPVQGIFADHVAQNTFGEGPTDFAQPAPIIQTTSRNYLLTVTPQPAGKPVDIHISESTQNPGQAKISISPTEQARLFLTKRDQLMFADTVKPFYSERKLGILQVALERSVNDSALND